RNRRETRGSDPKEKFPTSRAKRRGSLAVIPGCPKYREPVDVLGLCTRTRVGAAGILYSRSPRSLRLPSGNFFHKSVSRFFNLLSAVGEATPKMKFPLWN